MLWKCISGGLILKIFQRTPRPPILYHTSCKRSAKGYAMVLVQVLHPATHNTVPCYAPCLCTFWIFWRGNIHCKHNQILKYNNKGDCYVWFYRSVPLRSRYVVFVSAAQIRIGRACRNSSSRVRTVETAVSSAVFYIKSNRPHAAICYPYYHTFCVFIAWMWLRHSRAFIIVNEINKI